MSSRAAYREALAELTACLLAPDIDFLLQKQATDRFFNLLRDITALDENNAAHRQNLMLPSGKSIGAYWAATCLNDLLRTRKFVRGLYQGIRAAQQQFPDTRIHVLYAGTGPFASLALPMTQLFSPAEIRFTFLEIQPESAEMLQKTVSALQLQAFVHELAVVDATQFQTNPAHPIHVLVSETMQHGLKKEPQVAITMHLAPQLLPGGILIPERIDVWPSLLDPRCYMDNKFQHGASKEPDHLLLEKVFSLDRALSNFIPENGCFPPTEVSLDPQWFSRFPILSLITEIQVFGTETLKKEESQLTLPLMLHDCLQSKMAHKKAVFQYDMYDEPGFRMQLLEA